MYFNLPSLGTVAEVAARVGEEIIDDLDVAQCQSFLDLASAQVRHHGDSWENPVLAPAVARAITIEAAARGYLNPAGYSVERGDMITFTRADPFALGSMLTETEIAMLRVYSTRGGLYSVLLVRDVSISDVVPGDTGGVGIA
jgi:hypothetical protein